MNIRLPARAGSFYESSPASCQHHAIKLLEEALVPSDLPQLYGGLVPHAGWMYSGRVAALTLKALDSVQPLETLVLLGADHVGVVRMGEVYDSGVWRTPVGELPVDGELAEALLSSSPLLRSNPKAHEMEHSIEVQVPLLQTLRPEVKIVPIAVPATQQAVEIGLAIGKTLAEKFPRVRIVGSTDLTHHGGHFPAPGGRGRKGVEWSVNNDKRMLDLIVTMQAAEVIAEAERNGNACGAGAVAAAIAACQAMGARSGRVLDYTNSYDIIHEIYPHDPDDTTVGYASVVFTAG